VTTRLGIVILATKDLPAARRFYWEVFGWPVQVDVPVYVEFTLPGGIRLGVYDREAFAKNPRLSASSVSEGAVLPTELYFYTPDPDRTVRRALEHGGKLLDGRSVRPWGDEVAYVADPDGNVVALALDEGSRG
jgi:catechol 2,3-dioxygenase-like lactoylglutathione lyase family enzyme